jgi:peroxiredoxin
MTLKPRQAVPPLEFDLLGGGRWRLADERQRTFTMLVFYRGLHCPVCRRYTSELNGMAEDFAKRGVSTVITSTDTKERAEQARTQWGLDKLRIGHGVTIDAARQWGLYVSTGRGATSTGVEEPALFAEPGLFLIKPDATLYWLSVSSMPFARLHFPEIAQAIDFAIAKDYPARGEA